MTLPKELQEKWDQAEANKGQAIPVGRIVVCDSCDADFTDRPDQGGLIFGSNAYCPKCAPRLEADAKRFEEEHFIRARCPAGQSFGDFVRAYRGPDAAIRISEGRPRR